MSNLPLLSLLVWLPILGGALCLALGNARPQAARREAAEEICGAVHQRADEREDGRHHARQPSEVARERYC